MPANVAILADAAVPIGIFLLIGGVVAAVAGLIAFAYHQEKKRNQGMQAVAVELGLPFYPQGDPALVAELARFNLFSQGRAKRITNMLHGQSEDVDLGIFDYQYTTGSGKHQQTPKQTVISFCSHRLILPDFALRPENIFHRIGAVFGYRDISFASHPRFSKAFLLRGSNEERIRSLFNDEVLTFFEGLEGICVEAAGDRLICYRTGRRLSPEKIRSFMDEGFRVYLQLRSRCEEGADGSGPA